MKKNLHCPSPVNPLVLMNRRGHRVFQRVSPNQCVQPGSRGEAVAISSLEGFSADSGGIIRARLKGQGSFRFARATEASIADFEGRVKTALTNEIRFPHSRRVENLISRNNTSENFNQWRIDAGVIYNGIIGTHADPVTGRTFNIHRFTFIGTNFHGIRADFGTPYTANRTYRYRMLFRVPLTGGWDTDHIRWNIGGQTSPDIDITALKDGDFHHFSQILTNSFGSPNDDFKPIVSASAGSSGAIDICFAQVEDVTGQSNQNPSEYVPSGIPTGSEILPAGDQNFDTNWTLAGGATETDGVLSLPTTGASADYQLASSLTDNDPRASYVVTFDLESATGGGVNVRYGSFTYANTEPRGSGLWSTVVIAEGVSSFALQATGGTHTRLIRSVSVRRVDLGAYVDRVKYFSYENGNTVNANGEITEAKGASLTTSWGAMFEPASANVCLHSEDISNAVWDNQNCTAVTNVATSPDGGLTADRQDVTPGSNIQPGSWQGVGAVTSVIQSASRYVKDDGAGFAWLSIWASGSAYHTVVVNLGTGAITDTQSAGASSATADVEALADGWYRIKMRANVGAISNLFIGGGAVDSGTPSYTSGYPVWSPVDGQDILIWGSQLEKATQQPTSYIPTTTTAVSRVADDGTEMFDIANFDASKGMIAGESIVEGVPLGQTVWIGTRAGNPNGVTYFATTDKVRLNDGTSQSDAQSGNAFVTGEVRKWAGGWGKDDQMWSGMADDSGWAFGNLTPFDGAMPNDAGISVFNQEGASNPFPVPVTLKNLRVYDRDLGPKWIEVNY